MPGTILGYSGKVSIKLEKTKHIYRNNGTSDLFTLIAQLLCGNDVSGSRLPSLFRLGGAKSADSQLYDKNLLYSDISATKNVTAGGQLKLSGTLLPTNLIASSSSYVKYRLYLYSRDDKELAFIEIDPALITQIGTGRQAQIEWLISVNNMGGE